jgi:hypothetical protein
VSYIETALAKQRHLYTEIVMPENAIILGAALAGAAG